MNHYKKILASSVFLLLLFSTLAQKIELLNSGSNISIRGLSVVTDKILWVSGTGGAVGKSTDAGKTWQWMKVPGFEQRDFRDIEAFDAYTAIILAIAEPGQILKTTDGGQNWKIVYSDTSKGMFLDAMDFADEDNGVVIGDPLPGSKYIYRAYTRNGGNSWFRPADDSKHILPVQEGEAMFASSGSNVVFIKSDGFYSSNKMYIVTGGKASNFLSQNPLQKKLLPLQQGKESTGANSIAILNPNTLVIVGGDFSNDKDSTGNCVLSKDGGLSFSTPQTSPHGYRSCVEFLTKNKLVACGTSGVDISLDGGLNWTLLSTESFHVCRKAKKGQSLYLAGTNGRVAKLSW